MGGRLDGPAVTVAGRDVMVALEQRERGKGELRERVREKKSQRKWMRIKVVRVVSFEEIQ